MLLAFWEGEPAGFLCGLIKRSACYREPSAEVTELYVRPAFRRRGLAGALVEAFLQGCRREGVREVTLLTGGDNRQARAFYEGQGFSPSGEAPLPAGIVKAASRAAFSFSISFCLRPWL